MKDIKMRWNSARNEHAKNEKIDLFIEDVILVCKKHGLSLSHEDGEGAFEVWPYNGKDVDWLRNASDATGLK